MIRCDIRHLNWQRVINIQRSKYGKLFDVILIDPPWKLNVKVNYGLLTDDELVNSLPLFDLLDDDGLLFCWLVNAKLAFTLDWLRDLGFVLVDSLAWFKLT